MIIYGVALLAFCFLAGKLLGMYLGVWIGVSGDVGGVGFAMLLLMVINLRLRRSGRLPDETAQGIRFWSAMYLPIIVAMAATQNVWAALAGGPVAIVAGAAVTLAGFYLVPVIARIGQSKRNR